MDPKQTREEPSDEKCCYVLPSRFCLPIWAVLKLAADIFIIGFLGFLICAILAFRSWDPLIIFLALLGVALLVDIGFLIALIVGVLKKSITIIRVFFMYELYFMVVGTSCIIYIFFTIDKDVGGIVVITFGALYIVLDLCVTLLLKSEMEMLRNKNQCAKV